METREKSAGPERRTVAAKVELRKKADGAAGAPRIAGYAIVYDQWTTLYESKTYLWREIIRPGAAKNALAEKQDVRCLFNHDPDYVLGRTTSGTLSLAEDDGGLMIDCDPPDTQFIRDLVLAPIAREDVTGQSFAFTIRGGGQKVTYREDGDLMVEEREITDIDLYDVGPVTYPQYEQTDVALRSIAELREREIHLARDIRGRRASRMRLRDRRARALFGPTSG